MTDLQKNGKKDWVENTYFEAVGFSVKNEKSLLN